MDESKLHASRKCYHFCAMREMPDGKLHYNHGVITIGQNLWEDGAYEKVCSDIASSMKPPCSSGQVVILSLTRI